MSINRKNIEYYYTKIKKRAIAAFKKKCFNESLKELEVSARIAFTFNFIYSDSESEHLLKSISDSILEKKSINSIQNRIVFYDAFGWDNRCLTQQYIRAVRETEAELLFIYEKKNSWLSSSIDYDLSMYGTRVRVYELDQTLSKVEQIKKLFDVISEYAPSKAFLHIEPCSVVAISLFYAFPNITKYNINLTDHAFWLGTKCLDYNIEFRNYGYTVSLEKRGLTSEQCICLPYYPVINDVPFKGLPPEVSKDKICILSGGALYKIYSRNKLYFFIIKRILNDHPNVVIIYAGDGVYRPINQFIKDNHFENRLFLLGNRTDINEVFKTCDIYLATYPLTGGLMAQYAIVNKKPILAYSTKDLPTNFVEGIVCHKKQEKITHFDFTSFFEEVKRLCRDSKYRTEKGESLSKCIITPADFNIEVKNILLSNTTSFKPKTETIYYDRFSAIYLEAENTFHNNFKKIVWAHYRLKTFTLFPLLIPKILPFKIKDRIMRCLKKNNPI